MALYSVEAVTIQIGTDNQIGFKDQYLVLTDSKGEAESMLKTVGAISSEQPTVIEEIKNADRTIEILGLSADRPIALIETLSLVR